MSRLPPILLTSSLSSIIEIVQLNINDQYKIDILEKLPNLKQRLKNESNDDDPSVLTAACRNGGKLLLEWLLTQVPSLIDVRSKKGTNCLAFAASYGNEKAVDYLLSLPIGVQLAQELNNNKCTINFFSAWSGNIPLFKKLQAVRGDLNFIMGIPQTKALQQLLFKILHCNDHIDFIKFIFQKFPKINFNHKDTDAFGYRYIHLCAEFNRPKTCQFLIDEIKVEIDQPLGFPFHLLPIDLAAKKGNDIIFDLLLNEHRRRKQLRNVAFKPRESGDYLIHHAVQGGSKKIFTTLTKLGVSNKLIGVQLSSCLHIAATFDYIEIAKLLIQNEKSKKEPILLNHLDFFDRTPLQVAAATGSSQVFKLLLDLQLKYNSGCLNKVKSDRFSGPLSFAAVDGDSGEILSKLSQVGINFRNEQHRGLSPFHYACKYKKSNAIKFLGPMVDVNETTRDNEASTGTCLAAASGQITILEQLKGFGADFNKRNKKNQRPIDIAQANNHPQAVRFIFDNFKVDIYHLADGFSLMHKACMRPDIPVIEHLIKSAKNEVEEDASKTEKHQQLMKLNQFTDDGDLPMHIAAKKDYYLVIRLLHKHGFSITDVNKKGWSPLFYAVNQESRQAVCELIKLRANPQDREQKSTGQGRSVCHLAYVKKLFDLAFFLYEPTAKEEILSVISVNHKDRKQLLIAMCVEEQKELEERPTIRRKKTWQRFWTGESDAITDNADSQFALMKTLNCDRRNVLLIPEAARNLKCFTQTCKNPILNVFQKISRDLVNLILSFLIHDYFNTKNITPVLLVQALQCIDFPEKTNNNLDTQSRLFARVKMVKVLEKNITQGAIRTNNNNSDEKAHAKRKPKRLRLNQ